MVTRTIFDFPITKSIESINRCVSFLNSSKALPMYAEKKRERKSKISKLPFSSPAKEEVTQPHKVHFISLDNIEKGPRFQSYFSIARRRAFILISRERRVNLGEIKFCRKIRTSNFYRYVYWSHAGDIYTYCVSISEVWWNFYKVVFLRSTLFFFGYKDISIQLFNSVSFIPIMTLLDKGQSKGNLWYNFSQIL